MQHRVYRWHDVVIVLSIVAIAAGGFWAIWGGEIFAADDEAAEVDTSRVP